MSYWAFWRQIALWPKDNWIGTQFNDGNWHYLEFDLRARFDEFWPGETLQTVDGVKLLGRDLYVDDIVLSGGRLEKSYALRPGAAIGGYLGAQAGRDAGRAGIEWDRWYYHYNDLGTVLATTDAAGSDIGIYAPDFWGNYRLVLGERPDTLGLTSKFYDAKAGLYYFNARWYDAERGRFVGSSDFNFLIEHAYNIAVQSPTNYVDPNGQLAQAAACLIGGAIVGGATGGAICMFFNPSCDSNKLCMAVFTGAGAGAGTTCFAPAGIPGMVVGGTLGGGIGHMLGRKFCKPAKPQQQPKPMQPPPCDAGCQAVIECVKNGGGHRCGYPCI